MLSIDTTVNVGQFYVTSSTYQNPKFINQRTRKFVNVPGRTLSHVRQDKTQFLFFCNNLLEANYEFEKVRFVGKDRDKEQKGFLKPLKGATYLPCKKHIEDNMKTKMQSLQLNGGLSKKPLLRHDQGPQFKSQHTCAHTIAAACFNGCLESYFCSYTPRLSTLVSSSIPIHTGRQDNRKKAEEKNK